jgi:SWI/SNF-related matrix-associated actin-dependent regulator of chromatin subfamily A-like protein 1
MDLLTLSSAETSWIPAPEGLGREMWDHQRAALEYVLKVRRVFIADDVGVGKTAVAIAAMKSLSATPALIVPPAILRYKWDRELKTWWPGIITRIVEPNEPLLRPEDPQDPDAYIVSYNLLAQQETDEFGRTIVGKPNHLVRALLKKPIRTFIADEGHRLRTSKSLRTKACTKLSRRVPLRMILGGSPVEVSPRDLVSQLHILDQLDAFGGSWNFLQTYCNAWGPWEESKCEKCLGDGCRLCRYSGAGFGQWDFTGSNDPIGLNTKLRSTCYIRREKTQVHKSLPPLVNARVDLSIGNRIDYLRAEKDFIGWLETVDPGAVTAAVKAEALVKLNHMKRLSSIGKRGAATEWLEGFLEENPSQKLVIFTQLLDTADYYAKHFMADQIIGEVPPKKRDEIIQRFQTQANPRNLVVSVAAGGVGIELFAASNCVHLEFDWLPTVHDQASGRLHRPGQTSPVTAWWLIARQTVEENIFELLAEREKQIRAVTRGEEFASIEGDLLASLLRKLVA